MSSAVVPGPSSSCSAAFTRNHSSRSSPKLFSPQCQKTPFQGLSLLNAKGVVIAGNRRSFSISRRRFEVTARTAGSSKNIEVEVDKPLGVTLEGGGNASKAGLRAGDQVLYTSSFFGDELWPADKLGFTKTAIQAKPDSVYFVVSRGVEVDVKRLPKRPAPPRFGRKLTDAQKARVPLAYPLKDLIIFFPLPDDYTCPQCIAPKKRFARYDVSTGRAIGGGLPPIGVLIGLVAGFGAVGALLVYGLQ
ncbi:Na(+)/H(+) exchange regulatory cofactor NHE-RF3 like [Actinidia chinensis var. chinensis]|uniref:Na(+)/H(+) exchange regulatory cofactor NHE-RF3 like n=1 Tax=Actinidia chinensis var. chinensis TaxID=1590841 RepID=A0A2R6QPN0_ACTCC|nr:Na(+)/H(+) exchange regulatory cofactor NHE-RF3 like [Actinidia chinensis var. chinensis]